jgi:hypothetical protein
MKGDFPRYTKWVVQEMMEEIKAGR